MNLDEAIIILNQHGYITEEQEVLDEGLGAHIGVLALLLGMCFGVRACNGTLANNALKDIHTMDGNALSLFNQYNQENWSGVASRETAKGKAVFGAIIKYAQQNHCSVAQAAKAIKGQFAGGLRNAVSPSGVDTHITSVLTTTDGDEELVYVGIRYQDGKQVEHTEIVIPASAADFQRPHKETPKAAQTQQAPSRSSAEIEAMAKGAAGYRP